MALARLDCRSVSHSIMSRSSMRRHPVPSFFPPACEHFLCKREIRPRFRLPAARPTSASNLSCGIDGFSTVPPSFSPSFALLSIRIGSLQFAPLLPFRLWSSKVGETMPPCLPAEVQPSKEASHRSNIFWKEVLAQNMPLQLQPFCTFEVRGVSPYFRKSDEHALPLPIEFEFLELNAFGKICGDDCGLSGAEQSRLRSEQRRRSNIKKERRMVF